MKKALTIGLGIVSSISFAGAQSSLGQVTTTSGSSSASGLLGLINTVQQILDRAVPLIVSLAVIGLFWFLLQFVWKGSSDPKAREESIKGIGWSILAIFVMVAIWGIIAFIANVVGVGVGGDASAIVPKLTK
jgi:mannose/fructose/N-acetylgalactosamine-specific phosphotransferase system component IIC